MPDIFVFGSNLAGRHGKGAALYARKHYGAEYGIGEGVTGRAYAIPTKTETLAVRPIADIKESVDRFIEYAWLHPMDRFQLTAIGCGLAGYTPDQIAPLFRSAPPNVIQPPEFHEANHRAIVGGVLSA